MKTQRFSHSAMEPETIQKNGVRPKNRMSRGNLFLKALLLFIGICLSAGAWGQKYEFDDIDKDGWKSIVTINLNNKTINVSMMSGEILANYSIGSIPVCNDYDDGGIIFKIKYTGGIKNEKILSFYNKRNECYIFASGSIRLFDEGNNLDESFPIIASSASNRAKFQTLARYIFDHVLDNNSSSTTTTPSAPTTPSTPATQPPSGKIEKVWLEHNVMGQFVNYEKGMNIHTAFNVDNLKGQKAYLQITFYHPYDNNFFIETYDAATPPYDNTKYDDFKTFYPYSAITSELNKKIPSSYSNTRSIELKVKVKLFYDAMIILAESDYISFTYNRW